MHLHEVLDAESVERRELSRADVTSLLERWRAAFARPPWQRREPDYPEELEWHPFSCTR